MLTALQEDHALLVQQIKRHTLAAPLDLHVVLGEMQAEAENIRTGGATAKNLYTMLTDKVMGQATYEQMANDLAFLKQLSEVGHSGRAELALCGCG